MHLFLGALWVEPRINGRLAGTALHLALKGTPAGVSGESAEWLDLATGVALFPVGLMMLGSISEEGTPKPLGCQP